nr:unnamed protein product [Digitaria exilis]
MGVEEAAESCGSHAAAAAAASGGGAAVPATSSSSAAAAAQARKQQQQQRHKLEVYTEVLRRLHDAGLPEARAPGFDDELWNHFNRLPARGFSCWRRSGLTPIRSGSCSYAMDVNVERAEDVLTHKRLLEQARDPAQRPAFAVRAVQVSPILDGNQTDADSNTAGEEVASRLLNRQQSIHPPPAFGSSTNLEALALEASKSQGQDHDSTSDNGRSLYRPMHEVTFSTIDKPKLLSEIPYEYLTPLQAAVGVVQKGLRPTIPKHAHAKLSELLQKCWQQDPAERPDFSEILETLQRTAEEVGDEHEGKHKDKILGGLFSALRGRGH